MFRGASPLTTLVAPVAENETPRTNGDESENTVGFDASETLPASCLWIGLDPDGSHHDLNEFETVPSSKEKSPCHLFVFTGSMNEAE